MATPSNSSRSGKGKGWRSVWIGMTILTGSMVSLYWGSFPATLEGATVVSPRGTLLPAIPGMHRVPEDQPTIQAAIDAAQARNTGLYIPSGTYRISSVTYTCAAPPTNGILIYGDSPCNGYGTRGTIIQSTTLSGATFTVDGGYPGTESNIEIRNITFRGNATADAGLKMSRAWFGRFVDCAFTGFTKSGACGLWFFADATPSAYSGTSEIRGCRFRSNAIGVKSSCGPSEPINNFVNVIAYNTCYFLDHTEIAVQIGEVTTQLMQARAHNFSNCGFEINARDIVSNVSVYEMNIDGCYFEILAGSPYIGNPRISLLRSGASAPGACITICNNYFQHPLASAGDSIIEIAGDNNVTVRSNFSSFGNQTDRFFLTGTNMEKRIRVEPAGTPPGVTPYPIRFRQTGTGSYTEYSHAVNTADRPPIVPVTYAASMSIPISTGGVRTITPTDGSAFTIASVTFTEGAPQLFTVCIINTTGGALGAATWSSGAAGFKLGAAWTQPATGFRRYITFMFDPVANRAYEISRSAADVAN